MLDTPRLRLVPFDPSQLLALVESPARFAERMGLPAAPGLREFFVSGEVPRAWLDALRAAPGPDPWTFGFAVASREHGQVIGTAGFKGPPDADGVVEVAYAIAPAFEGRGYATEAAAALVAFAEADDRVRTIRAHTLPDGAASQRVLERCGFARVGPVDDPDDGPVVRWERAAR